MANWIQDHILEQLIRHETRRYSELKPQDIEGNLFMYHLKGLMREHLIEKDKKVYKLTSKGMHHVSTLSLKIGKIRKQPQILNAIVARNQEGEYLFSKWKRQPNIGLISFPHGMMHYGEPLMDAVKRELAEKAGMEAELVHKGNVFIRAVKDGKVERHMLVQLFEASNVRLGRQDELRVDVAESFWARLESLQPELFMSGFYEIAKLVNDGTTMPNEIKVDS